VTVADSNQEVASPLLDVMDAAVHYGGVKAVDNVTLRLTAGRIFGIIGPNGSGKSTLLAALSRLVPLTAGRLEFVGRRYERMPPYHAARLGIARTFQTVRLLPEQTVAGNVQLGADLISGERGFRSNARDRRRTATMSAARSAMERCGIAGIRSAWPHQLAYGVQRQVEIARAIAAAPRLLLLDEPTAGMNQAERSAVAELMKQLRDEGLTQLLVEHDVQMMLTTCDYVFAMNSGRLIAQGPPDEVVQSPVVREAYLGQGWAKHA